MTTDERAFRLEIAVQPDDDTPRLVYADWLDENGQPERAEYIRTAVEYHTETRRTPCTLAYFLGEVEGERVAKMSRLERGGDRNILMSQVHPEATRRLDAKLDRIKSLELKLIGLRGPEASSWRKAVRCPKCEGKGWRWEEGKRKQTARRDCPHCWAGDVGGLMRQVDGVAQPRPAGRTEVIHTGLRVDWARGFPDAAHCTLAECFEAVPQDPRSGVDARMERYTTPAPLWRPAAWARAVVTWHPVSRFVITDRTPTPHASRGYFMWVRQSGMIGPPDDELPSPVFDELEPPDFPSPYHVFGRPGDWRSWPTAELAINALARALARLARRHAASKSVPPL